VHHASDALWCVDEDQIEDEILMTVKEIKPEYRNGVPLLPRRPNGPVVTTELVNRLRDEDE
jgi:hypothetical protein